MWDAMGCPCVPGAICQCFFLFRSSRWTLGDRDLYLANIFSEDTAETARSAVGQRLSTTGTFFVTSTVSAAGHISRPSKRSKEAGQLLQGPCFSGLDVNFDRALAEVAQ